MKIFFSGGKFGDIHYLARVQLIGPHGAGLEGVPRIQGYKWFGIEIILRNF